MDRYGTHSKGPQPLAAPRALTDGLSERPRALTNREAARGIGALLIANARYWPRVAPLVRREIARWEARAQAIPDPALQALATGKLEREHFNAQTAAILATAAPRSSPNGGAHRTAVAEAIVALQVAYDYLDALGEQAIEGGRDGGYLRDLLETASGRLAGLPAAEAVTDVLHAAMERALEAQARAHANDGLESWARRQAEGSGLGWVEWLAGAQASVLCAHALIAAAADPTTTRSDAEAIDRAYLAVGSVSMLDSLLDADEDTATGQVGYLSRYESAERMGENLAAAVRVAVERTRALPHAAHHQMLLAGLVAYYASAPAARVGSGRVVTAHVRRELRPLLTPALATMRAWRTAKALATVRTRRTAKLAPIVFAQVIW